MGIVICRPGPLDPALRRVRKDPPYVHVGRVLLDPALRPVRRAPPYVPDQSPARVDVARLSMRSRISHTRFTKAGSRSISFGGRSGGGTTISRRIVPGAEEKT